MGNQEASTNGKNSQIFSNDFMHSRFWNGQPVITKRLDGLTSFPQNRTRVRHPHILSTLAVENGDVMFETTPEDLHNFLRKGPLGENDMLAFLRGTVSALAYLQGLGISHGYLISHTIFHEQSQGAFKIYDQEILSGKAYCFTAAKSKQKCFLAPELMEILRTGAKVNDESEIIRADVFSLGMVAIEAGTGLSSQECFNYTNFSINYEIIDKRLAIMRERFSIQIAHTIKLMIMPYIIFRPDFIELFNILINVNPGKVNIPVQKYNPNRMQEVNNYGNTFQSSQSAIMFVPNVYSNNLPIHMANENNYKMTFPASNAEFIGNQNPIAINPNLNPEIYGVNINKDTLNYVTPVNLETLPSYLNQTSRANPTGNYLQNQSYLSNDMISQTQILKDGTHAIPIPDYNNRFSLPAYHSTQSTNKFPKPIESPYDRIKSKLSQQNSYLVPNTDVLYPKSNHARPFSVEKNKGVSYNITINHFDNISESQKLARAKSPDRLMNVNSNFSQDRNFNNTFPVKKGPKKSLEDRLDSVLERSQKLMEKIKVQLDKKAE